MARGADSLPVIALSGVGLYFWVVFIFFLVTDSFIPVPFLSFA